MTTLKHSVKNIWLKVGVLFSVYAPAVLAAGDADDVFDPLNEKTDQLVSQITTWAASLSLLCIVGFGTMTMLGKFSKFWGVCIVGGCLIILVGSGLSAFLLA